MKGMKEKRVKKRTRLIITRLQAIMQSNHPMMKVNMKNGGKKPKLKLTTQNVTNITNIAKTMKKKQPPAASCNEDICKSD
jgi:hypothetical protein